MTAIRHLSVADAIALYLASAAGPVRARVICRYMAIMHDTDQTVVLQELGQLARIGRIKRWAYGVYWWA